MRLVSRALVIGTALVTLTATDALAQPRPAARTERSAPTARRAQRPGRMARLRERFSLGLGRGAVQREVRTKASLMEATIRRNATPPVEIVGSSPGARLTQTRTPIYKKGQTAAFDVSGVPDGHLSLTALLPVSGHVGFAEAQRYAQSNVYNIKITHPDGSVETLARVKATGFVTEAPIDLKLKPGKTIIQAWADGSAGVGGYRAGREIELNWSGN